MFPNYMCIHAARYDNRFLPNEYPALFSGTDDYLPQNKYRHSMFPRNKTSASSSVKRGQSKHNKNAITIGHCLVT